MRVHRARASRSVGEKHIVRFEPVGIEIEVDEDQTILRAAAEQGVQLMHGCKEGQCAACKSFVLEGDWTSNSTRYSTFALPDYEKEEGSDPALPGARLRGPGDRAPQLRRGDHPVRAAAAEGRRRGRRERAGHPRHAPPGGQARRARGDQVLPRPVPGLHGARHRREPVVLDGEHARTGTAGSSSSSRSTRTACSPSTWPTKVARRRPARGGGAVRHLHPAGEPHRPT